MSEPWYERVAPDSGLLQGDFILDCPLLDWNAERPLLEGQSETEVLTQTFQIIKRDVVVMTQACDLEQRKVDSVVVCPIVTLSEFKNSWSELLRSKNQNFTEKGWRACCSDIRDGFLWNYAMLNCGKADELETEHRIVDFHDIYTLPVEFLEGLAFQRGARLRLRPPYREHLSQAFARYFMRVGLPSSVDTVW